MNLLRNIWKERHSLEATITLRYKTRREAESVANAVLPDNVKLPAGLFIETSVNGLYVLTFLKCITKMETFMATIDDFFSCVSLAEEVLSTAKEE